MRKSILLFFSFFISICSLAQWTDDYGVNTLVSNTVTSDIISTGTGDGKTYVVYWDEPAGYVLRTQLLDADGNQLFEDEGMVVNDVADNSTWTATRSQAVDNAGNIYISFTATGDGHGYANKISPSGDQLWGGGGIDLGESAYDTKILPTEDGGAVIGWYANGKGNLMKYDADGNALWGAVKVLDSPDGSNPFTSVGELALLSDGSFIVFMHVKGTSWMINSMFWAQRYAADGTAVWANPVQISNQTTAYNRRYEVLQDGDVTYLGYYGSTGFRFDSFLQRVNADGTLPWGINGVDFSTNDTYYEMETNIAFQEDSDYIWSISRLSNDTQSQFGEYVQKFDKATGARMFTDNAKQIFAVNADSYVHEGNLQLVDDKPLFLGSTGIGNGVSPLQLFVVSLDENGDFAGDEDYIEIATTATAKSRVDFTKNVNGQSVAVWTEDRGSGSRAYAQNYKLEVPQEDCDPVDIPYTQDFETAVVPGMPECTSVENAGSGNNWETSSGDEYGFTGTHLRYKWNVDNPANSWFFTQGVNLTAGTAYKISYDYGSAGAALFPENLKVAYGTTAQSGAMGTVIADHPGILTGTSVSNTVEFEVDADGVYYFGFNAYSDADMFYLFLDNIHIELAGEEPGDYCEPVLDCTDGDLITNVTFAGIDNDTDCSPNGYGDYTSISGNVESGSTNEISVTVGGGWAFESVSVWIDYDNSFTFDEDEFTYVGTGSAGDVTGSIAIPSDVAEGSYRMRVRVAAVGEVSATWDMACDEDQTFGETEDYTLVVGDGPVGGDCDQTFTGDPNTGVGFINNGTDVYVAANDVNVEAGSQFNLETISLDVVTLGGEPTMFDLSFYTDNGGVDEQIGSTLEGLIPSSITPNGTFGSTGFPVYTVELTLDSPQLLQATPTESAKYWVALSGYPSVDGQNVYWVSYLYTDNPDSEASWQSPDGGFSWAEFANTNGEAVEGIMTVTGECETLGISDMTSFDFAYYPNPVKDVLNISSKKAVESVSAFNLAGQQVMSGAKVNNGQVNVSTLPSGAYVFRVTLQGGQVETFKIIKK